MNTQNARAENLRIAYIGGGSRGWAWNLMSDLIQEDAIGGTVVLYDIDREAAHKNEIIGNAMRREDGGAGRFTYRMEEDLETALTGADFVVISILPGTFEEMEVDVHLPEKYGVYQSVGDTAGPGGILRALRTMPMYVTFAKAIQKVCPQAWVINYTNPMAVCLQTLYAVFPDIRAFGCCHEVFGTQEVAARLTEEALGIEGIARRDIAVNVMGINHFTWIDQMQYQGRDILPLYRAAARRYAESGFEKDGPGNWMNSHFHSANRVKFDLCNRYGLAAAAGDRHLAEFCPPWYLKDPKTVREWMFSLTPVSWRKENRNTLLEKSGKMARGELAIEVKKSGEEGVAQMKAILGLGDLVTNVNLPNRGQISNVRPGTIVETNAWFTAGRVQPLFAGAMPEDILQLSAPHILSHHLCVEACRTRSLEPARRAFLASPLLTASLCDANALFDEMVWGTRAYLGQYAGV